MNEATNSEDLWNPYKDLLKTVNKYLCGENKDLCFAEFENTLKKYKQNFFALLQNPPKNAKNREDLKKGTEEGINVRGIGYQTLSKELYQEAIIISDMYDLNEFSALDLLCTAQIQMPYYPGLPRGLVAILLYYDGRKALVSILRMLVQARKGVLWSLNIPIETEKFITSYTDQLMESGLFNQIFELLKSLDLSKEIEMLQQNVALGGPKHQRQVSDLFTDIRVLLADIVFLWSSQCGLPKQVTINLINHLRVIKVEEEASGKMDNVTLYLLAALLATVDLSILHTREDGEEVVQSLPILSERDFIEGVLNELLPGKNIWSCEGLQATVLFAFAVCLSTLRLVPQSQTLLQAIEQEETLIDTAISLKVFKFLNYVVLKNKLVYTEDIIHKRIHNLITDFIVHMYSKVKELRMKADETARTMQVYAYEGLEAPTNLPRHFEDLLYLIAKFYSKDPLNTQYVTDYWCPLDNNSNQGYTYRAPARAVSLFKFIRLAGDMVPSTLFVPYLNMLASLSTSQQTARFCFNMLKQTTPGINSTITWDHFFMSFNQYYTNLRQEMPPTNDTVYRHRTVYHKGITPQEVEGLHAVLQLIQAIAEHDDFSRLALCEHPGWAPLSVLLGLVSCSVPIPLKADILFTLAALSKSPETANIMWNNLEASQILITIPSTSSFQPRGIQTELDEVESRMEEYPLTKSLLKLLDVLTDSGIPRTLGAGPRKPGFDPYLTFIINSIFLKFNTRSYKNAIEKWEIASICLKLFEKFLAEYVPELADFPSNDKSDKFNSPPGFHLLIQLNSKSDVLNLILYIINEGISLFDTYKCISGYAFIESCTLSCLRIIDRDLILQSKFFNLLSMSSSPIPLTSLSKLLLTINPRTGRPDHVLNIARYVSHYVTIPNHTLTVVKVILNLTSSPLTHAQIMNILLSSVDSDKLIRNGFVECLDAVTDGSDVDMTSSIKESIISLLKQCLPYKAPNLSHFLLGFDVKRDVSTTLFQIPGILDFPRTCIHSIFGILKSKIQSVYKVKPSLLESTYHLLYLLCAGSKTSGPTLKLLRMQTNFFKEHVTACFNSSNEGIQELNQLSSILMTLAIELKVSCTSKQINYVKQLTKLLVNSPSQDFVIKVDPFTMLPLENTVVTNEQLSVYNVLLESKKKENLLVQLITQFDFNVKEIVTPRWEFFDNSVLNRLLNNCQTEGPLKLINIKKLHQILIDELGSIQGTTAIGQRQAILQEIQKVLMHALNINNSRQNVSSMIRFVDSWRQVTEVLITYLPYDILTADEQQVLEIFILEHLLKKVVKVLLLPEIGNFLSGVVLLLLENLRKSRDYSSTQKKILQPDYSINVPDVTELNSNSLRTILNHLIEWILAANITAQKLRINLYGALVTFLQLVQINHYDYNSILEDSLYISRLDSSKLRVCSKRCAIELSSDVLPLFGEKLLEVLCQDCIGGQEVCRMLAMSSFSLLISLSGNVNWIAYMSGRGYLKHIIQSILDNDNNLRLVLEPVPENIRPLYIYEAKMSLLAKLATTRVGAELLLEQHLLSCLSNMKVFDYHPEISKQWEDVEDIIDSIVLPVENRYLQIWLPSLHLCNSVLTSLGTDNKSAVVQIMHYLLSHLDVVELILRAGNPTLPSLGLKELSVLTSVIARTANSDLMVMLENVNMPQDNRAHLHRIQKLMLSLLAKFILSSSVIRELLCDPSAKDTKYQSSERLLHTLETISNLLLYARNLIANHGIDHSSVGVIFQPTLNDPMNSFDGKKFKNFNEYSPSLGVIVQQLISTVAYYHKEKITVNFLQGKLNEIPTMNTLDIKEFVTEHQEIFDLNFMREKAYESVSNKVEKKKREIEYCTFIIENSLYLIWAHLDYYMLRAISKTRTHLNTSASFSLDMTLASASEAMWKVSTDDISNLKQGLVSIFTDSFSNQLLETAQGHSESDKGLIEALLRKIKRLIQFVPVK